MQQDLPLFPPSASTLSIRVDALYFFLIATSGFFALLILVLVVFFAAKYRRGRKGAVATHIEGSLKLEIFWTVVPLALSMVMFWWGASLFFESSRAPDGAMEIQVTAKQWMWKLQHPTGAREINQLHVPVHQPVRLTMTSEDVIHSFYVPAFRVKRDVLPGRYSSLWFEATKPGTYPLYCAEYCGTKHSLMIGEIHVLEPEAYSKWLASVPASSSPRESGEALFRALRCDTCHSSSSGARGPDLAGLIGRRVELASGEAIVADLDYVRESILRPNAKISAGYSPLMPTFEGQLSEDELLHLVAYVRSLTTGASDDGAERKPEERPVEKEQR